MPRPPLYLAIDQGTHASRAAVFSRTGELLASELRPVSIHTPEPGRVEQDPEALLVSIHDAIDGVQRQLGHERAARLTSAGMATQRSTIVCWDCESGNPLTPALSWQDTRAAHWLESLAPHAREIAQRTGLRLSPHYGASKLRWCLEHAPAVVRARDGGRLACGPLASFLAFRLLREAPLIADPCNASRTLLWSPYTRDWDPWLLERFAIPRAVLPDAVPSRHAYGTLALNRFDLPLTVILGDQPAALFANGDLDGSTVYINAGTGAFILRPLDHRPLTPEAHATLLTSTLLADTYKTSLALEGTVNGAGAALSAFAQKHGIADLESKLPAWLDSVADPPLYLNGIGGVGSPLWLPHLDSHFTRDADTAAEAVAVVESVVFLLAWNLQAMRDAVASPIERIVASGGLSRLDGLCQRLANLADVELLRFPDHEATARGAAYLAAVMPAEWRTAEPARFAPRQDAALERRYTIWREAMLDAAAAAGQANPPA